MKNQTRHARAHAAQQPARDHEPRPTSKPQGQMLAPFSRPFFFLYCFDFKYEVITGSDTRFSKETHDANTLHHSLLRHLLRERLLRLRRGRLRLDAHDASAPRALDRLGVLVVLLADGGHQLAELMPVLEGRGRRGVSGQDAPVLARAWGEGGAGVVGAKRLVLSARGRPHGRGVGHGPLAARRRGAPRCGPRSGQARSRSSGARGLPGATCSSRCNRGCPSCGRPPAAT